MLEYKDHVEGSSLADQENVRACEYRKSRVREITETYECDMLRVLVVPASLLVNRKCQNVRALEYQSVRVSERESVRV